MAARISLHARPQGGAHAPSSHSGVPLRLRLYIGTTVTVFSAGLIALLRIAPARPGSHDAPAFLGVALLVGLARAFPVRLAPKRNLMVDTAPAFAAVLLLPPPLAAAAVAAGTLGGEVRRGGRRFQVVFNAAAAGLGAGAASCVHRAAAIESRAVLPVPIALLPLIAAALALYLINGLLVDAAAGLTLGQNPFRDWWTAQRRRMPQEPALVLLGLVAALAARHDSWLLPLLIVPAAAVRRSLHARIPPGSETREALASLAQAVDLRHQRAADHSYRVAELSRVLARGIGLPAAEVNRIIDAARFRDIGEIVLPPDLLGQPRTLTDGERAEAQRHAVAGARMVERFPDMAACAPLIRHHHERWDGWGSPDGLTGEAIPLGARIIAVADTYEAMIATRPYREALSPERAVAELRRCRGTQLDPRVVDLLLAVLGQPIAESGTPPLLRNPRSAICKTEVPA